LTGRTRQGAQGRANDNGARFRLNLLTSHAG